MANESRLEPPRYRCRTHDVDLTDAVQELVDHDKNVTANLGFRNTADGVRTTGSFTVDVTCPSDPSHRLRFMGRFER